VTLNAGDEAIRNLKGGITREERGDVAVLAEAENGEVEGNRFVDEGGY
jgi:hypothetical protein